MGIEHELVQLLCEKADRHGIESLRSFEADVVRVSSAYGVISNGGFKYYYEGWESLREVAEAFDRVGLGRLGDVCRRVESVVSEAMRGSEWSPSSLPGELDASDWWDQFAEQKSVIYSVSWEELFEAMGDYLAREGRRGA